MLIKSSQLKIVTISYSHGKKDHSGAVSINLTRATSIAAHLELFGHINFLGNSYYNYT